MTTKPTPKKIDSLGRKRREKEAYAQHGGWKKSPKHFVYQCKSCDRRWPVASRSSRYDAKCRTCGVRNTILLTLPKTYYRGRERVTRFSYYPSAEEAKYHAIKWNKVWMENKVKSQYRSGEFHRASIHNKLTGSIDNMGHVHPKTKEMSES
tara:strand:+ start:1674 stop:2126 length:453 start_codon:yes stop_codon:yes gene_type:complete